MTPSPLDSSFRAALFKKARARFPGASRRTYLDVASRSLVPASALDIAARHLAERVEGVIDKDRYFDLVEKARRTFASLIGATPAEIAFTKNVSEGLNVIASAIDWKVGDEVFLCSDIEHPNNVYTWRNLERLGVAVRDFPAPDGQFPLDSIITELQKGSRARVVTVSATSFKPGYRTDLDRLGHACRQAGAYLIVDGAQSIGITHLDVSETPIDALAVSTQKGLCSLYGMGFLYVRHSFAETLAPRHLARFGVLIDATHEADYDRGPIKYRPGALRFDLGNYNFLATSLVQDAMDLILECSTQSIDAHVTALATQLTEGLLRQGLSVVRAPGAQIANIVCIGLGSDADAAARLQEHLKSRNVQAAVRRKLLRFSIHLYNDASDIAAALEATGSWAAKQGGGR